MNLSLRPYLCTHSDEKPNDGWIPWAYYSVTCGDTYKTQDAPYIELSRTPGVKVREDRALCTSQYSEMDPLTDGDVPFATLEGRPSVMNFEHDTELQVCQLNSLSHISTTFVVIGAKLFSSKTETTRSYVVKE